MAKKEEKKPEPAEQTAEKAAETAADAREKAPETPEKPEKHETPEKHEKKKKSEPTELEKAQAAQAQEHEQYLRLAAEYDNFRKRTQREKDGIYLDAVADTAKKLLPVYDNLERALKNETSDEAYKKGVEMTMNELVKIFSGLGIAPFGAAGETFDPQRHNAVMHTEDDSLGENVIAEVFQTGFTMGERVIRFAMVKVAN